MERGEEMNSLEKALIGSSIINVIFQEYQSGELNSSSELVRKRIATFMRIRSKSNRKLFLQVIKKTDKAWKNTINHFVKQKLKIEAKATISAIYNYMQEDLEKFANIKEKDMEMFTIQMIDDVEAEKNSGIVVDYLMSELGLEKKKSLFAGWSSR